MQPPPTRYVDLDVSSIAYQVVGEGPVDMLISPGFISHLDLAWADHNYAAFLARLSSFARLILYDKLGTGLSDPPPGPPTLERRCAEIEAVLDAAGSERAVLLGISEGGPPSMLLAATRPQRVVSLILVGTFAVFPTTAPEYYSEATVAAANDSIEALQEMVANWGEGTTLQRFAPSMSELQRRMTAIYTRAAASPRMAATMIETAMRIDMRDVLPSVGVPTLVLHVEGDRVIPFEAGKRLAEGIPGARFLPQRGNDHSFWWGDPGPALDEIERFVTGTASSPKADRVLATVLFTDIVDSTRLASEMGDAAWHELLIAHDETVEWVVKEHGGRVVKHIGDGALCCFNGPAAAVSCAELLHREADELGVTLRTGVHTGECESIGEDLGGLAVHIGARVGALGNPGEILVSSTVMDLVVGSGLQFVDRGQHELKGVPGNWRLHAVTDERSPVPELDGPQGYMRRSDRFAVAMARHAPRAFRFGSKLAGRGRHASEERLSSPN